MGALGASASHHRPRCLSHWTTDGELCGVGDGTCRALSSGRDCWKCNRRCEWQHRTDRRTYRMLLDVHRASCDQSGWSTFPLDRRIAHDPCVANTCRCCCGPRRDPRESLDVRARSPQCTLKTCWYIWARIGLIPMMRRTTIVLDMATHDTRVVT
jgi:hypothetical protein